MVKRALVMIGAVACTWIAVQAAEPQGIRGRAALQGTLVEGLEVRVYAYRPGTFGPLTGDRPVAVARTATDGTYRIGLSPGRYVVEGIAKHGGNRSPRPEPGDLYCLYSGSPVAVAPEAWTPVGLNLVRVPPEGRTRGDTAIRGRITFGGELVEKCYLYVYTDAASAFRGPAPLLRPVRTGAFRIRVPPGTYYLVARKRARGGPYGPMDIGDRFNFYPLNPVRVTRGETVEVEIPLVERLSQLEEDPAGFRGLEVRVIQRGGAPAQGYYVLAYPGPERSGPPVATSLPTGPEGSTRLPVAPGTPVYLRTRRTLGGPLGEDEPYGDARWDGQARGPVIIHLGGGR